MLCVLAYSGIRNSELCNLRVCDVDIGNNRIRIHSGKNFKDRYANITGECAKVIVEYLRSYPRDDDAQLFTTIVKKNPLATGDLRKHVRVSSRRANIERRVYPHLLRHSLATNLLIRGASLITIKDQLGHDHYETSLYYLRSIPQRAKAEYNFCRPSYL